MPNLTNEKSDRNPPSELRGGDVRLFVADPAASVASGHARLAVAHGLQHDARRQLIDVLERPEPAAALGDLVARSEEATIVLADATPQGPTIDAWRGATSSYEAYIVAADPGGAPAVCDHFRDAMALVPPERRTLEPDAVTDHLLFGTVPGTQSHVVGIRRLGHGDRLHWQGGRSDTRQFDSLVARPPSDRPPLDAIEAALDQAVRQQSPAADCANQLSGGIDSSLLQTFLPAGTPTVSGAIDSPEFARERSYAERASEQLGTRHEIFAAPEDDYPQMLVDVIRLCGLPIHMPQTAVYNLSFANRARCFINGQFADAVFGLQSSAPYAQAFGQRRWLRLAERLALQRLLPRSKALGLSRRLARLRQLEAPLHDWQGAAARFAIYSNPRLLEQICGQAAIRRRIEARATYVAQRFRSEERDPDPLYAHLEFGHLLDLLCDDSVSQWRQLARAQGKVLCAPFVGRSVVEAALAVPRGRRYIADGRVKHLLKDLLKRRLPAFDVDARKGGGDLPFARYLASGPLKDAFDRYAMPDFVDRGAAAAARAAPDWLTWNLLTLAIWRDEVLADAALGLLPGTRLLRLGSVGSPCP